MNITNPIPTQFPSTYELLLSSTPQTLFVIKIVISNPKVAQTITFYNQNGSIEGQPVSFTSSLELKLRYVNYSKITFSDSNSYNIFASIQTLTFTGQENRELYQSDADLSIVPINNAEIIKPLDGNGYVETDDIVLNAKIAKLNQDANGNQGVNLENPIPSGTNSIGTVGLNGGNASIGNVGLNPYALTIGGFSIVTSATVNTSAPISATSLLVRHFIMTNTGSSVIYLGSSDVQMIALSSGGTFFFDGNNETTDLNQWYTISPGTSVSFKVVYQY